MAKIANSVTELIGATPMLCLERFSRRHGLKARLLAKLEFLNPTGSVKDRAALAMIDDAEKCGVLQPGAVVIEPTSGNTGIGLAAVAAARGYRVILTMPESMSVERRKLLSAYGAELVLTESGRGMPGAIEKAKELASKIPGAFIPGQFENPANPKAHYLTTGPEIWADTGGRVDIFIAGVGTGGTISGAGAYLREKNPELTVIAVEPGNSPVLSGGSAGSHGLQGIGAGFVPDTLDVSVYDEIIAVAEEDAYAACRALARTEGILAGITSGAAIWAAAEAAKRPQNEGKTIVAVFPDTGSRYLSTPLFD